MQNIHDRQRLLEAVDDYLIYTPVAPGFTHTHLNSTKDILLFIVSEKNDPQNGFIQTFNQCITELSEWEKVLTERNDLAYTLLAMRVQKELRRFKDVYLLPTTG